MYQDGSAPETFLQDGILTPQPMTAMRFRLSRFASYVHSLRNVRYRPEADVVLLALGRWLSRPIRLSKPGSDFLRDLLGGFWPTKLHCPHAAPAISAAVGREQIGRDVKLSTANVAPVADHRHVPHKRTELLGRLTSASGQKQTRICTGEGLAQMAMRTLPMTDPASSAPCASAIFSSPTLRPTWGE